MSFEFNNETPIFLQIIEHIKMKIISKNYLPNEKLPSVRELSFQFGVNPNTIQKALSELEGMGLIITERTNGKFVTGDEEVIKKVAEQTVSEMIDNFFTSMQQLGFSDREILEMIRKGREK